MRLTNISLVRNFNIIWINFIERGRKGTEKFQIHKKSAE